MKFLLTGGKGKLAQALIPEIIKKGHAFTAYGKDAMDITEMAHVTHMMQVLHPDIVINCAAVLNTASAHDKARSYNVNVIGTSHVATMAKLLNSRFVQISTDYVFDGTQGNYNELAHPHPINYYGYTKSVGDAVAEAVLPQCLVVRAPFRHRPWPYKKAFVDQFTSGRWIEEVAPDIVDVALDFNLQGVLNMGGERKCIYTLAKEVSPDVETMIRSDWGGLQIPRDVSLNSSRWEAWKNDRRK